MNINYCEIHDKGIRLVKFCEVLKVMMWQMNKLLRLELVWNYFFLKRVKDTLIISIFLPHLPLYTLEFQNIGFKCYLNITISDILIQRFKNVRLHSSHCLQFPLEVLKIINRLAKSNVQESEKMSNYILKRTSLHINDVLAYIFNL